MSTTTPTDGTATSLVDPLHQDVVVHLAGGRQDVLSLADRVTDALEHAGRYYAATAFARAARACATEDELLTLSRLTVTVL